MAKKKIKKITFLNPLSGFKAVKDQMSREDVEKINLEIRRGIGEINNSPTENVHVGGFTVEY